MRLSTARLSTATTLRTAPKCAARRPFHTLQSFRSLPRSACFAQTHLTTSTSLTATFQSKNVLQSRGVKTLDFGGTKEKVVERSDYPKEKLQKIFAKDTMAVIGYGVQGMAQSLNMKDHGLNVIVGVRQGGKSWNKAIEDGWVPGKTLFPIEEAAQKGTVIMYLLSDAGQKESWPTVKPHLTKGKTLYFSHGFSVVYKEDTKVEPPKDIDVILVAPKGSGTTVRRLFLDGQGINSSVAVFQDASGQAQERAYALGIAVGSGYLYDTTFEKEVYSDLTGERGVLMGAIYGLFRAQYDVLRSKGHSPSEAFNETVEEATQSLYPLIGEKGMDWMYANCSTTAQRGALDWNKPFYNATKPLFQQLYDKVANGDEARRTLEANSRPDYRQSLEEELRQIRESEMWRAGETVRSLRPRIKK
ncbi:Bifunctional acetohydroxyacid reductoisomerase [Balamuthia mandrillaris]